MANRVVTRFAPSPTGFMHVGGLRTALFAWLFARQNGGTFILRIEDTDKEREVEGSIKHIMDSLRWLGLSWDFGPDKPGPWGSTVQSERLSVYKEYAQKLIDKGYAYQDPYNEEQLATFRAEAEADKRPFLYRDHRPRYPGDWDGTKPLRFKVPQVKRYEWHDAVRGTLSAGEEALDDFILIKSDGYPTYNFSHIVDDLEMGVTHIIRAEEFIASTPKFLSLYDALGVKPPVFATMPVILGPDGKKKLSKRDGAKDVLEYRAEGYVPEAIANYLALLGWHPSDDSEVMGMQELIAKFELERVQKGGAKFDEAKLLWINREHLLHLTDAEYAARLQQLFGQEVPYALIPLVKERARTLGEAVELLKEYNFLGAISYDPALLTNQGKINAEVASNHLKHIDSMLEHIPHEGFNAAQLKDILWPYATSQGRGDVLWPLRTALSGKEKSPDPFILAELLGKDTTRERIATAIAKL
ncbi:MAG TPA: glutamate--tRNA ligase [Candidatus Paceibacterota bacterium]